MPVKHIFFDLDGTLVDSYPGILFSFEAAMKEVLPNREPPNFVHFVGPPVREVFRLALTENDPKILDFLEVSFRKSYDLLGFTKTNLYPGVFDSLAFLHQSGKICHILTNKPKKPTLKILDSLSLNPFFTEIFTPDSRQPSFTSKEEAALEAKRLLQLNPSDAIIVGDSKDDALAAKTCGFHFAAVTYGYGRVHEQSINPIHFIVKKFKNILKFI
jgi:phosphoglycolate phosphatase